MPHSPTRHRLAALTAVLLAFAAPHGARAQSAPENVSELVTGPLVQKLRAIVTSELVQRSVQAQNAKYGDLSPGEIDALDKQWRAEREASDQPLIAMTLSNPLSSYLTRSQANELGLYAAIFVMDKNGLNVGQSAVTSDFWQGDEAKFIETFPNGADAVFVDQPEYLDEFDVWIVQISMTLVDPATRAPIGAATFDVNLAELQRRARPSHGG